MPAPQRGPVTRTARALLDSLRKLRSRPLDAAQLAANALVCAPHPDDETLGCGATIVQKGRQGAAIHVVFMTDGAASHARRMNPMELRELREREAADAMAQLGLPADHGRFLRIPDGSLDEHSREATEALRAMIRELQPCQIIMPCRHDQLSDHVATRQCALEALRLERQAAEILEFPVWFWNHWPWMRQRHAGLRSSIADAWRSLHHSARLLRDFNAHVDVGQARQQKLAALQCHRTQMSRLDGSVDWLTLADVADGDFLACLLGDREIYRRWQFTANGSS